MIEGLSQLVNLQKLDLSYSKQIDDATLIELSLILPKRIRNLSLRFLDKLTGDSLKAILENLIFLEGLDISGCFGLDLSVLCKLRGNTALKCLLLEYLLLKSDHLKHLQDTRVSTLSMFYSKAVNFTHLEALKGI